MAEQGKFKWKVKDVFNVFVASFVLEFLLFLVLNIFDVRELVEDIRNIYLLKGLVLLVIYILQVAALLLPLWFFVIRKYGFNIMDFGFKWIGTGRTLLWVFASYIFYIGLGTFIIMLFYSLGIGAFGFEPPTSLFEIFGRDPFGVFIAFIIAILLAPFIEEIFFRGFVLQTLSKKISPFWGVVLTALIFAAVHFEFQSIMPLIILSVILNVLYVRTNSIWPGIVFHIFNNSVAFITLFFLEYSYFL